MFLKKSFLIFLNLFVINEFVFASHPLLTEDIFLVDKDKFGVELTYYAEDAIDEDEENITENIMYLWVGHGITDKMDFEVTLPYQLHPDTDDALGDVNIAVKYLLIKDALVFNVTHDIGVSNYFVNFIFSKEISPLTFYLNPGYLKSEDIDTGIYNTAVEYNLYKSLNLVGEINADDYGFKTWLFGLQYDIMKSVTASIGFGRSFEDDLNTTTLGLYTEF